MLNLKRTKIKKIVGSLLLLKLRVNFVHKTENSDATPSFVVAKLCLYLGILPQGGLVAALCQPFRIPILVLRPYILGT